MGRRVKPAQGGIADREGQADPSLDIFGKPGVEGGGKGKLAPETVAPRRDPQRSLGGDVDGARLEAVDEPGQTTRGLHRQADLAVGRAGQAAEKVGRDHPRLVAERCELVHGAHQRAHHAVHLRQPGVGNDDDSHGWINRRRRSASRSCAVRPIRRSRACRRHARRGRCSSPPSRRRCSRARSRCCGSPPCGYGRR